MTITAGLFLLGTVYIGVCLGYWSLHRFFAFFPSRRIKKLPSDYNMSYDEVFFQAADRTRLQGWVLYSKKSPVLINNKQAMIVFFSGWAGTMSKFLPGLNTLLEKGFNVFTFGYRGFGQSDFRWPTEKGVFKDAEGAVTFLVREKGLDPQQLILYGQSLGCALASRAAVRVQPRALILEGGFLSLADEVRRFITWLPVRLLTTSRFSLREYLPRLRCRVLVAHSAEDRAVGMENAEKIFHAAHEPKDKIVIHGPHAQGLRVQSEPYVAAIIEFITKEP